MSNTPDFSPEHHALIQELKNQLLIVFINRLGGKVEIPIKEIDDTGKYLLLMSVENRIFTFEVREKQ